MPGFKGPELVLADRLPHAIRSWDVQSDGTLTAVANGYAWSPGVNRAECFHTRLNRLLGFRGYDYEAKRHSLADCTCGFYAYYTPLHMPLGAVRGVVRYSGECVLGTKGVRAEKAEIVALIRPWLPADLRLRIAVAVPCFVAFFVALSFSSWNPILFVALYAAMMLFIFSTMTFGFFHHTDVPFSRVRARYPDAKVYPSILLAVLFHRPRRPRVEKGR
jgi:hypothetical protein